MKSEATEFDREYQANLQKAAGEVQAMRAAIPNPRGKQRGGQTEMLAMADMTAGAGGIAGICDTWDEIQDGFDDAMWYLSWVSPKLVVKMKAWFATIKTKYMDRVCPPK